MQVFCDFDGTISVQDATDFILTRFADSEWQPLIRNPAYKDNVSKVISLFIRPCPGSQI